MPHSALCPLLLVHAPRARPGGLPSYDALNAALSFALYIDVDAACSAVLLCRTQTNTHTTQQTNMNKQPERHSGNAQKRHIKLTSRKNSAHCACLFASWQRQLTLDVIYFVSVDMGHARTRRTTRRRLLFVMGLFV